jgi:Leucine-rich repeat (LRR) protein
LWERVNCSRTGTVSELHLYQLVPPETDANPAPVVYSDILNPLFRIRSLELLDISFNSLLGEIPGVGFGNLTKLVRLEMNRNRFNGSIPSQIFELISLKYLDLSDNILDGVLSPEVCKLQNLEHLLLQANFLSGRIPKEIGNITKLREFSLQRNHFFGEIPSSIVNIKKL